MGTRAVAILGLILAGVVAISEAHAQQTASPEEIATQYCTLITTHQPDTMGPLLTPSLTALMQQAQALSDAKAQQYPEDKPPLGDGIPYQTHPDDAPICRVVRTSGGAHRQTVTIFREFPEDPRANWADHLLLKRHQGQWRIDDVRYQDTGFRRGLRRFLKEVIEDKPVDPEGC